MWVGIIVLFAKEAWLAVMTTLQDVRSIEVNTGGVGVCVKCIRI